MSRILTSNASIASCNGVVSDNCRYTDKALRYDRAASLYLSAEVYLVSAREGIEQTSTETVCEGGEKLASMDKPPP